jgi:hypothetical protein
MRQALWLLGAAAAVLLVARAGLGPGTTAAAGLPLAALPLLAAGATLHFAVMRTSMGLGRAAGWARAAAVCAAAIVAGIITNA